MNSNAWFTGTGIFAALCLENFFKNQITFTKILTGLPTRSGRNGKENPSAVELKANSLGLAVTRTGKLNDSPEILQALEQEKPDVIFVIDFGQIIKEPFLSLPRFGCWNIHPSLLPAYRGAAPIQRALMNGSEQSGVSLFRLVKAMDAGEIIAQEKIKISHELSASDLYTELSRAGVEISVKALKNLPALNLTPQNDSLATYAEKINKNEFELSSSMTAENFLNVVRALDMSGGAYIIFKGKRLKIWRVKLRHDVKTETPGQVLIFEGRPVFTCSDYGAELLEVQAEGKKKTSGAEWARGNLN